MAEPRLLFVAEAGDLLTVEAIDPESGESKAPSRCSNVLLPAPEGPTTDTNCSSASRRLTPSSARTV